MSDLPDWEGISPPSLINAGNFEVTSIVGDKCGRLSPKIFIFPAIQVNENKFHNKFLYYFSFLDNTR